jgi:outer membrane protein
MRNILRTILPAILLMTVLCIPAMAQTKVPATAQMKVATVDMRKLFDNYWKTKRAQASIQERAVQLDKDDTTMKADLKKAADDYQKLLAQAKDPAISSDERDHRQKDADDKLKQLGDKRSAIEQYERQAQATLTDQRQRMRDKILDEIQAFVSDAAKTAGCAIVMDSSAQTVNATPIMIYHGNETDLSDVVLKLLNAGAPIDMVTATNSLPPIPTPMTSFLGTNRP